MFKIWARLLLVFAIEELFLHSATKGHVPLVAKVSFFVFIVAAPGLFISFLTYAETRLALTN